MGDDKGQGGTMVCCECEADLWVVFCVSCTHGDGLEVNSNAKVDAANQIPVNQNTQREERECQHHDKRVRVDGT